MIGQYLSNTNESATVSILQNILKLNNAIYDRIARPIEVLHGWLIYYVVDVLTSLLRDIHTCIHHRLQSNNRYILRMHAVIHSAAGRPAGRRRRQPFCCNPRVRSSQPTECYCTPHVYSKALLLSISSTYLFVLNCISHSRTLLR